MSSRPCATFLSAVLALTTAGCTTIKRFAYDGAGRARWQQPDAVVRALGLSHGQRVVDLGAGAGFFTLRLAEAVGTSGLVQAVDVDAPLLTAIALRARRRGLDNVETVVATDEDVPLPPASADLIFVCNVYHHLVDRAAYFERVRGLLRPGGRLAIVEYDGRDGWIARAFGHATPAAAIRRELAAAGYRLVAEHAILPRQSFMVFAPDVA